MRILIVEDDRKLGGFLLKGFKEEGHEAALCLNGDDAMIKSRENTYDLIILDILLPGRNGLEVCQEMRQQGILTPILMLTALDSTEDKIAGLNQGADDYLTKPFSFEELLARIHALERRHRGYRASILKSGDLELDPLRRMVTRSGKRISLTGKEYSLLEYLLRNKGKVITYASIIGHIWETDFEDSYNLLNVYINHLREKIDKDHSVKLIRTIRGRGYQLDDHESS